MFNTHRSPSGGTRFNWSVPRIPISIRKFGGGVERHSGKSIVVGDTLVLRKEWMCALRGAVCRCRRQFRPLICIEGC